MADLQLHACEHGQRRHADDQQGFRDSFGGLAGVEQDANRVGGRCAVAVVRHAEVRCVGVVDVALRGFAHDASILVILDNYLA